jgi:lipopolysaccharide/colanic/teichoic acid biosynthesis glycosyltransferase
LATKTDERRKDERTGGLGLKIVISGTTGFVGRNIIGLLRDAGAELLLVGRDPARIRATFPDIAVCSYEALEQQCAGFDLLVHLATINNDKIAPAQDFRDVNVDLALETAASAKRAGVGRFIYASSIHALDETKNNLYASSKREGARRLAEAFGEYALTLYLPAIYGQQWAGKLAPLNKLPLTVARPIFSVIAALKPTLSATTLADFILHEALLSTDRDIILSDGQQDNMAYRVARRVIDLGFAAAIAVCLWWLLIPIWIAIRLESPGPGIFAQKRVGRDGQVFTCYKFRTMKLGTVEAATNLVSSHAVTRIGRFLRKYKVDEFPQILNILRNEISLVGPRPGLPIQQELIAARQARGVLALKPGITGLSQINDIDMSDPENLARWDARYGALQCLILDAKIILATATGRGKGDRVAKDNLGAAS